ncbi:MlaD family protein [Ramlibacter sp. PS3R-8]|uniref:MlaD family protein n=1 Tax=Ramlibacter sp. PS3R-8 TaxID=3133437 RepID=UPI0030B3601D
MSMGAEARARAAFAAAIAVIAAAAAAWFLLDSRQRVLYEVWSHEPVSGLIVGAPVEFHGVDVGRVNEVQLKNPRLVRVLLEVDRDAPVTTATVATITGRGLATRGFTGYVYVSLEDSGAAGRPLSPASGQRHAVIATAPAQSINLDTSISQLNRTAESINALLQSTLDQQTVASLKASISNLDALSQTLAGNSARLGQIIANADKASGQMQPLLSSSQDAVSTLRNDVLPQARETVDELRRLSVHANEHLRVILQNAEQASTRLDPLLRSSNEAAQSLQTQILPEAQRTLSRLDRLSISLDETAVRIRKNPAVLLRGTGSGKPGPGETP